MANQVFSRISEELVAQILSRLPPRSLMRFKCIRKSWYVLMNDPNFVKLHISNYNSTRHKLSPVINIIFKRVVPEDYDTCEVETILSSFNLNCDDIDNTDIDGGDDHLHSVGEHLKIPPSISEKGDELHISSHCDGIVCLTDLKMKVVLSNPAIKEFKLLPESQISTSPEPIRKYPTAGVGIGCDLKYPKNYKIVRLVRCGGEKDEDDRFVEYPPKAEVYTLGADSWREIEIGKIETKTGFFMPNFDSSIYCKGFVYWCAKDKDKEYVLNYFTDDEDNYYDNKNDIDKTKSGLLSFDVGDEVFDIIPYPNADAHYQRMMFSMWNESFALIINPLNFEEPLEIWVMDDAAAAGVKGSWTKYMTFELEQLFELQPLAYGKSIDQVVMVAVNTSNVVLFYNLCSGKLKYLRCVNVGDIGYFEGVVCANSLVSIKDQ